MIATLRIPKAASSAMVAAFRDVGYVPDREPHPLHPHVDQSGRHCAHWCRLEDIPADALAFAVLRDPVGRFRSAYDQAWSDGTGNMRDRFPDIDDFISAGPDQWNDPIWGCAFWPSTFWLRSADYVRERGAIVMSFETFANDLRAMYFWRPSISHAAVVRHTPTRVGELHDYYFDDLVMREELLDA